MSQLCAATKCDRVSRVVCDCCTQKFCVQHLVEHNAALVAQLNPLTDGINTLDDRLNKLNLQQTLDDCHAILEAWRSNCHQKIDRMFEKKWQELDLLVARKIDEQREKILPVQTKLAKLIRDQEASRQDIDTLKFLIRHLDTEMSKIEQARFSIETLPLPIDDNIIQVKELTLKEFDPSTLSSVYKTLESTGRHSFAIASNNRLLSMHQAPNLCLLDTELKIVKQVGWSHDIIYGMCWSSTLESFIVIVKDNMFLVDENTVSIKSVQTVEKQNWFSCTCFNDQLFLSTKEWGSSIVEMRLSPSISITKEWKSPDTCSSDELIDDMVYNNKTLALLIRNNVEKSIRMELRCCKMLVHLSSLSLDIVYQSVAFRCGVFDQHGWLVIDHNTDRLLHITTDGKMKQTIPYKPKPQRVTLFGPDVVAVSSETGLSIHQI